MNVSPQPPAAPWPLGPELERATSLLAERGRVLISGLEGGAKAFALARAWLHQPCTWLGVCHTLAAAEHLARDLEFFLVGRAGGQTPVHLYPAYEFSPYQDMAPPPEVTARRWGVRWELLAASEPLVVVTSARGLTSRLCPPEYLVDNALELKPGQALERQALQNALRKGGYSQGSLVEQMSDFAVRGSVIDFYGPLANDPVRVEFFDDEVKSLRSFDPNDQRSQLPLKVATLIPCHPVDLGQAAVQRAVGTLRKMAASEGLSTRRLNELLEKMQLRVTFSGLESLLPLNFPRASALCEYLPENCQHVILEPAEVQARLLAEAETLGEEFEQAREEGRIALPPPMLRRTPQQTAQRLESRPHLMMKALALTNLPEEKTVLVPMRAASHTGLHAKLARKGEGSLLEHFLGWVEVQSQEGRNVILVCRSRSQVGRLLELFAEREVAAKALSQAAEAGMGTGRGALWLVVGALGSGFAPLDLPLTFVTEDEVFGARVGAKGLPVFRPCRLPWTTSALAISWYVDHGIGRYEELSSRPWGWLRVIFCS
ncbi:hypothetical protein DFAR_3130002 [Desulfarculales bacterium]